MHQTGSRLETSNIQRPTRIASGTLHHMNRPLPRGFRSKTRSGLGWTTSNKSLYFVTTRLGPVVTKPVNPFIETASFQLFSRVFFLLDPTDLQICEDDSKKSLFCHAKIRAHSQETSESVHRNCIFLKPLSRVFANSCRRLRQSLY